MDAVATGTNVAGAAQIIGQDNAFLYVVLPVSKAGDVITVAASSDDPQSLRELEIKTRHKIVIGEVRPSAQIRDDIRALYKDPDSGARTFVLGGAESTELAAELLAEVIERAAVAHSSDIHFEPLPKGGRVKFRVDRTLREIRRYTPEEFSAISSVIKQRGNMALDKQRHFQDGSFHQPTPNGRDIDVRVSVIPVDQDRREKFVLRLLGHATTLRRFADLGLPEWIYDRYRAICEHTTNLHLVAGPTGAGKTSTVFSILAEADESINILTIEDPVEIRLPNAWQVAVDERTDVTFAAAMRAFMRGDPDIIVCGEMRDAETAKEACAAGLAGRRVWTTTHAPDAVRTIQRLIEFGVNRSTIAQAVRSVLAQRIVRRLCPDCRQPEPIPFAIARHYERLIDDNSTGQRRVETFYRQATPAEIAKRRGCKACHDTGISGQRAIFELLVMTDEIEDAITHEASRAAIHRLALEDECGYIPMRYHAVSLLCEGETSVAEVNRASLQLVV